MSQWPDEGRPSTWVKHRPVLCKGCHALCCTLPVEVSVADLQRMEVITPDEACFSVKKIAKKLIAEGIVVSARARTGLFTLRQHPNNDCIYLDENRLCKIYDKRPQVCRSFPQLGPRPGWCPARPKKK